MLRTRRLCVCAFLLGCVFVFGAWICMGDIWSELRRVLVQYPALSYFDGKSSSVAEQLFGNAIGAYSVSFGFCVEYFGQKKEIKNKLTEVYVKLRKRCFKNIFCKENAYDPEHKEVAEILEYISENIYLIKNYRPISIIAGARIRKLFLSVREKITGKKYSNRYQNDDVHALIATVILDIYRYFMFIASEQMWIEEAESGMKLCSDKMKSSEIEQEKMKQLEIYYVMMKHQKTVHMNRLVSRFPFNSKHGVTFMDKHEVYRKIYAINAKLSSDLAAPLAFDYLFSLLPDSYIVKDKEILYDAADHEVKQFLGHDEVQKKVDSLQID